MPETIMEEPKKNRESPKTEEEVKAAEELVQLVVFDLGGEEYGLGITEVKEIVKTGEITYVPNTPDFIRGIINLRGKMVVVMDMEKRFLIEREEEEWKGKHIIIIEKGENTYGLMVDEVSEVLRLPEDAIKEAPKIITTRIHADYLKGVGTLEDRLIIILNLDKVLAEEELAKLSQSAEKRWHKVKKTVKETKLEEAKKIKPEAVVEKPEEAKPEVNEDIKAKPKKK